MGQVTILVGAQWGDEGKGKWIDILAANARVVARYQGGNNAGHTLYINGEKIVLHQIPSGIFQPGRSCALTAGVVVNPSELVKEQAKVAHKAQLSPDNLWISARAHVISPWHVRLDGKREEAADRPIGTTRKGIGPTYGEKVARTGLRIGEYVNDERRKTWRDTMRKQSLEFAACEEVDREAWDAFEKAAASIRPFVCDAEEKIRIAIERGDEILLEGAQGSLLDIHHGTYPYVTSSSTCAGGAVAGIGFHPRAVGKIYGVAKAYVTRVGEGPMPTELFDEVGKQLATKGHEFGATTGRPRRCGWLDGVALRFAARVNGFDGVILNKMDILTGLPEIKMAVAYEHPELGRLTDFPWDVTVLAACKPVYETFPGWSEELPHGGKISELPKAARAYVEAVGKYIGCPVSMVGTGVGREDALFL